MIRMLTIDEVVELVTHTPEQAALDWKQDFTLPSDDEKRGELIKDIVAIANSSALSYGFVIYGVNPQKPDPVVGVTNRYDDSRIQQLVQGKVDPHPPNFLYYEVTAGPKTVSVIQIAPSKRRPFVISVDIGKIRSGQIPVRRGSSTRGATTGDLLEFFYGENSGYFAQVCSRCNVSVQERRLDIEQLRAVDEQIERKRLDMARLAGLVPLVHRK